MSDAFLGLDRSGNGNNWTVNNMTLAADQVLDSCTNNFACWNPIGSPAHAELSYSEGNLEVSHSATGDNTTAVASMELPSSGKWYWEVQPTADGDFYLGVGRDWVTNQDDTSILVSEIGWAMRNNGTKYTFDVGAAYGGSYGDGDIVGIAVDVDNSKIWFGINNDFNSQGSGNPSTGANAAYTDVTGDNLTIHASEGASTVAGFIANFGQDSSFAGNKTAQGNQDSNGIGDFYYTPPTDFLALCTQNLPEPTVIPSEHFNTVLYTGNDSTNVITGVGWESDLIWFKGRSASQHHQLSNSQFAVGEHLTPNNTNGTITSGSGQDLTSIDSDGFTLGSSNLDRCNVNGTTYVAWNWKANGSGGTGHTQGTITSTVSANQDAGFSIVSYTGNGTSGATIGHGLSSKPEMLIVKKRNAVEGWQVLHTGLAADYETDYIEMHLTAAKNDSVARWNDTQPTTDVFSVGNHASVNTSSDTYIAYCFHSVDGYSKVGSYTGNGNADGTFVYTGFRPAYVMLRRTNSSGGWNILDNKRAPYNPSGERIQAQESTAVDTHPAYNTDFLSNGFKLRGTSTEWNGNGDTFIYIAFAETPFSKSNAR